MSSMLLQKHSDVKWHQMKHNDRQNVIRRTHTKRIEADLTHSLAVGGYFLGKSSSTAGVYSEMNLKIFWKEFVMEMAVPFYEIRGVQLSFGIFLSLLQRKACVSHDREMVWRVAHLYMFV